MLALLLTTTALAALTTQALTLVLALLLATTALAALTTQALTLVLALLLTTTALAALTAEALALTAGDGALDGVRDPRDVQVIVHWNTSLIGA